MNLGSPLEVFTRNMFTEVIQSLSAFLAGGDFTVSEIAALHVIDKNAGLTVSEVAERLNLSISATSRLLSGLERKKLVLRKRDTRDTRVRSLSCTSQGRKFLDAMSVERARTIAAVISSMPEPLSQQLLSTIKRAKGGLPS